MQKSRAIRTSGSMRSSRLVLLLAMVASSVVRWLIGGQRIGSNSCHDSCSNLSTLHINYCNLRAKITSHLKEHRCLGPGSTVES